MVISQVQKNGNGCITTFYCPCFREKTRSRKEYADYVSLGEPEELKNIFGRKNLPSIPGAEVFVSWVKEMYFGEIDSQIPETKRLAPTIGRIRTEVCRGILNTPGNAAIYLSRRLTGESLITIGRHFNLSSYSSASSVVARFNE